MFQIWSKISQIWNWISSKQTLILRRLLQTKTKITWIRNRISQLKTRWHAHISFQTFHLLTWTSSITHWRPWWRSSRNPKTPDPYRTYLSIKELRTRLCLHGTKFNRKMISWERRGRSLAVYGWIQITCKVLKWGMRCVDWRRVLKRYAEVV